MRIKQSKVAVIIAALAVHFRWVGATSKVYSYQDATLEECPEGYTRYENRCTRFVYSEPAVKCHKGVYEGGNCVSKDHVKAVYTCPSGYEQYSKKHCKIEKTTAPIFTCMKGSDYVNNECIKVHTYNPTVRCEPGYKYVDATCVSSKHEKVQYECDAGYSLQNKDCISTEVVDSTYGCPRGYTQTHSECVREIEGKQKRTCPAGYNYLKSGLCAQSSKVRATKSCDVGFTLKNGKCVSTDTVDLLYICRTGDLSDGECVTAKEVKASYQCPDDHMKLRDGTCVRSTSFDPHTYCPDGVLKKNKCVSSEAIQPSYECRYDEQLIEGECVKSQVKAVSRRCPKGFKEEGGSCVRRTYMKPRYVCDSGTGNPRGDKCLLDLLQSPNLMCSENAQLIDNKCVKQKTEKLKTNCPKGYQMSHEGTCLKRIFAKPTNVCEEGEAHYDKCAISVLSEAFLECPKKFVLDATGACVLTQTSRPTLVCPAGTELVHDKCKQIKVKGNKKMAYGSGGGSGSGSAGKYVHKDYKDKY